MRRISITEKLLFGLVFGLVLRDVPNGRAMESEGDPVEGVRDSVKAAAERFDCLIDFLERSEGITESQVRRLKIAAKGVGEKKAEASYEGYGPAEGAESYALAIRDDKVLKVFSGALALHPEMHPVWIEATSRVLSAEQLESMKSAIINRSKIGGSLFSRLDRMLFFDEEQRAELEPVLKGAGQVRTDGFILPAELSGIDKHMIKEILSDVQFEAWSAIMQGRTSHQLNRAFILEGRAQF